MKILIADTYYPDFLKSVPINPAGTYDSELTAVLSHSFGTADFFSRNLRALGHECIDVISNHDRLQDSWNRENGFTGRALDHQIDTFDPDVLFLQDLSLRFMCRRRPPLIAAQCSCAFNPEDAKRCDVIFTSLPGHVEKFQALGVRAVYLPLAFEPSVVDRCHPGIWPVEPTESIAMDFGRIHDVVFIGGVGNPSHWRRGMKTLEAVAREIPTFKWWGYGYDQLTDSSALRSKYQGEAWGLQMYEILLQSKICLNRHGEVAQGYANNLRMFEATGCGAMLLTDNKTDLFVPSNGNNPDPEIVQYDSPEQAIDLIHHFLGGASLWRTVIAENGQARTLRDHTYSQRMKTVSEVLTEMICLA